MATATICLLYCDQCVEELGSDEPLNLGMGHRTPKEARQFNRGNGGNRVKRFGQWVDLCAECHAEYKALKRDGLPT